MNDFRIETDALGKVKVPARAYYGAFTARALNNFQISGHTAPKEFRFALGTIKIAAAETNYELGELEKKHADAIIKAAKEFRDGKYDDQFKVDIFQAGAGTPLNMNANEIISNRANEILGGKLGKYTPITPNNHVNWGQSSNDVIPSAIKIAAMLKSKELLTELEKLTKSFDKKSSEFKKIMKIGRSHLQDAVPITLGQEFEAYAEAFKKDVIFVKESFEKLSSIGLGGTALGTGITSHPDYKNLILKKLNNALHLNLRSAKSLMQLTHNMNTLAIASNSLKILANNIIRIGSDLRILASGPAGGMHEITMPEVEAGSSIMPGKVNPSIPEAITMVAYQVIGNDLAINLGVQASQLELNVMTPMIMHNLFSSLNLLINGVSAFREKCIDGIKANKERCSKLLENSLVFATGLSGYLSYKVTAELVKEASRKKMRLKELVKSKKFMSDAELDFILSLDNVLAPHETDKKLKEKIQKNRNFQNYIKALD